MVGGVGSVGEAEPWQDQALLGGLGSGLVGGTELGSAEQGRSGLGGVELGAWGVMGGGSEQVLGVGLVTGEGDRMLVGGARVGGTQVERSRVLVDDVGVRWAEWVWSRQGRIK